MLDSNWYVLAVYDGKEDEIARKCMEYTSRDLLKFAFVPKYKRKMKIRYVLQSVELPLFPGYIFLETEDIESLYLEISKIKDFKYFIARDDDFIHPILRQEKQSLMRYIDENFIIQESIGVIVNDKIEVIEGPLKGQEGIIRKIDRRKYVAWIDVEFMGRTIESKVGLDIIEKR